MEQYPEELSDAVMKLGIDFHQFTYGGLCKAFVCVK